MQDTRIAKLFKNGGSQAVRLPAEYRFETNEVYITRDETTGDITLSTRPAAAWTSLFDFIHGVEASDDFMSERPMNVLPSDAGIFDSELP